MHRASPQSGRGIDYLGTDPIEVLGGSRAPLLFATKNSWVVHDNPISTEDCYIIQITVWEIEIEQTSLSSGMKPREPRREVLIQARMRVGGLRYDVCIRNISSRGLLLQAATAPSRGTYVEIFVGPHTIVGRVVWQNSRRFGVQTQDRLNVSMVIAESACLPNARELHSANRHSGRCRSDRPARTAADVAAQLERSRRMSAALEFGCLAACSAAAAALTVSVVFDTFSRPLERVAGQLRRAE